MSNESYSSWLKNSLRDPLFWIWVLSLIAPACTAVLDLAGVIDRDVAPYSTIAQVSWLVFGAVLIIAAVRGTDIGQKDQPMSTAVRVFTAVIGIVVLGVALVLGLLFPHA